MTMRMMMTTMKGRTGFLIYCEMNFQPHKGHILNIIALGWAEW